MNKAGIFGILVLFFPIIAFSQMHDSADFHMKLIQRIELGNGSDFCLYSASDTLIIA